MGQTVTKNALFYLLRQECKVNFDYNDDTNSVKNIQWEYRGLHSTTH